MKQLSLVILAATCLSIGLITVAGADPGGRTWGHGFFSNAGPQTNNFGQVILNGLSATSDKNTFINEITTRLYGASARDKTGAAFIIQLMRGDYGHSRPTAAQVADWKARVNNPDVTISIANYSYAWNSGYMKGVADDDAFYPAVDNRLSLRFMVGGAVVFAIKQDCGNPVGNFPSGVPLKPAALPWSLDATSTANVSSATPGDTIQWTHTLFTKSGSGPTTTLVHSNLAISGFTNGWLSVVADGDTPIGTGPGTIRKITDYAQYTVTQADLGNTLCEKVQFDPADSNGVRNGRGNNSCVTIPYNFNLTPSIAVNPTGVIEPGASFNVTPSVYNSGVTKNNPAADWKITKTVSQPGFADAVSTQGGSGFIVQAKSTAYPTASYIENDTDKLAGTHICYVLSINHHSSVSGGDGWVDSNKSCITIGKKPKFQIWGASLWTNGKVSTSTSVKGINTFGSWDEYGIFTSDIISGMASGSAFAPAAGLPSVSSACDYSKLSFTNSNPDGSCSLGTIIGNYTNSKSIPDVAASFPGGVAIIPNVVTPDNLLASPGLYVGNSSNLTLAQSTLAPGKSVILKVGDTVTISGNQTYNSDNNGSKYKNSSELPQLVIIANKIIINSNVTNIDAWLIAKADSGGNGGFIYTCEVIGDTVNKCNNQLVVNGPVMANKLYLRRTAGSGTGLASGDPAEILNLRADAYLWASNRASVSGNVETVYTTELPPRF